jgi:cell division protease FtsH
MNSVIKTAIFWLVITVSALLLWQVVRSGSSAQSVVPEISYSDFLARVASGQVNRVTIAGSVIRGSGANGSNFRVIVPSNQSAWLDALQQHGVEIWFKETTEQGWPNWILNLAPLILLAAVWFFIMRQMQGRRSVGEGPSSLTPPQETKPRFGP